MRRGEGGEEGQEEEEEALQLCLSLRLLIQQGKGEARGLVAAQAQQQQTVSEINQLHHLLRLQAQEGNKIQEMQQRRTPESPSWNNAEEREELRGDLRQAISDLAIAHREIEAKDKQIVALLRRQPSDPSPSKGTGTELELRAQLAEERQEVNRLRDQLAEQRQEQNRMKDQLAALKASLDPSLASYDA
eukprot:CAMPEP_0184329432 /NCGR_PEP_ID=MMETSP1049-20130417/144148_1 /TAXON_ID=77928 /ORGANISM="Proteomonas sulcata, Strain CCMP704" /LENGTH=188 /DNA_ID=CAMNT_0026651801 /DNA_START=148 /DNA_END=714 /DNA_ORIENTATION=+